MAFPTGWGRRCRREVAYDPGTLLSDFPACLTEDTLPAEIFGEALSDGGDIRVTLDEAGTLLVPIEIELYDDSTPRAAIHLLMDLDIGEPIWVWWDKAGEVQPDPDDTYGSENVWDDDFLGVWHLGEDPSGSAPQMLDSTANAYHGTASNMESGDSIAAVVGRGVQTDGSDEAIEMDADIQTAAAGLAYATLEAVLRKQTSSHQLAVGFASQSGDRFALVDDGSTLYGVLDNGYPSSSINNTNWHHLACRSNGGGPSHTLHVDAGTPITWSSSYDVPSPLTNFYIGRWLGVGYVRGEYAEVRLSKIARSNAWLAATHATLVDNASFWDTSDDPEDVGGGGGDTPVTPAVAAAVAAAVAPTVQLGAISVTPAVAAAPAVAVAPSVVLGSVSITPAPAACSAAAVAPSVLLGAASVSPAPAAAAAVAISPTVDAGGSIELTPAAAACQAAAVSPAVQLGSASSTPEAAASRAVAISPAVSLGAQSITPAVAEARALAQLADVLIGDLQIQPGMAECRAVALAPQAQLGAVNVSPAAAIARALAIDPTVGLGSVSVSPAAAAAIAAAIDPTVEIADVIAVLKVRGTIACGPGLLGRVRLGSLRGTVDVAGLLGRASVNERS